MRTVRRTANLAHLQSPRVTDSQPTSDLAGAIASLGAATHGAIVAMRVRGALNDSLEDLWPGLAAEVHARKVAGISVFDPGPEGPYRHPQHVLDEITEQAKASKPRKPRAPKAAQHAKVAEPVEAIDPVPEGKARKARACGADKPIARKPRKLRDPNARKARRAASEPATSVPLASAPPVEAREIAPRPAARAILGRRCVETTPLPTAAKRVIEGAAVPTSITGIVTVSGSFSASTGDALVIDIEGQNNIARGVVVWAGALQDEVRAAAGRRAHLNIRQPSNPRFKPSVAAISAF
ncbi:hypothetical protein [Sphingomonas sp. 3-13AW]|uniref:hypothetical protein n=1 Tax=Sphingomonas sp. 3-13AW TaxID=3050450 RepID=UPI003BB68A2F